MPDGGGKRDLLGMWISCYKLLKASKARAVRRCARWRGQGEDVKDGGGGGSIGGGRGKIARFNREEPRGCNIVADFVAKYSIGNGLRLEVQILLSDRGRAGHIDQRPHKVSFYVEKVKALEIIDVLSEFLEKRGLDVKIIYSSGAALDVFPGGAGKGQALAYLLKKFAFDGKLPVNTLVCGDSGNDAELFTVPEVYGVMVCRLIASSVMRRKNCCSGIIQAIGNFGLGSNVSPRDIKDFQNCKVDITNPGHEVVKFYLFYERWRRAEIEMSERHMQNLKTTIYSSGIFVYPSGFEQPIQQCIDAMKRLHGDRQENIFECGRIKYPLLRLAQTHGW
ncbi:hypothetical protein FNV43_RR25479 [Rhamnella rubrinervis]|uniref:Sucrose-phosphate phosphatase n=1 Tax=Rhamnella rubrinervis TaxID=2594499 RepID=A0A8K0DPR0_9ROSA|nr:hypothetical protein FNV43_RR25479 [Rhamnella rubrinervis]